MSMTKTQVRALASRLAKVDEDLQGAIATLNQAIMPWSLSGTGVVNKSVTASTLSPAEAAKNALVYIELELSDIKQIMQAAGAPEARK
jgi:hypothetical protein